MFSLSINFINDVFVNTVRARLFVFFNGMDFFQLKIDIRFLAECFFSHGESFCCYCMVLF